MRKNFFENEWIRIDKLNTIENKNVFIPSLEAIRPWLPEYLKEINK